MVTERLFLQERLDQIWALLQAQGRVSVSELCERFGVSAVTIRNDLATLEQQGRLLRTHGGAMLKPDLSTEPLAFALRKELHQSEKERIGRAAAAGPCTGPSWQVRATKRKSRSPASSRWRATLRPMPARSSC